MEYETDEFSRITGVPVKTLRFYREEGLLVPRYEHQSGRYYYSEGQVDSLGKISVYRQLGMSTRDIGKILAGVDVAGILKAHRARIAHAVEIAEERADAADIAMENIDVINIYEHEIHRVPGCVAYYITGKIRDIWDVDEFLEEMRGRFAESDYCECATSPRNEFITFLEDEYKDSDIEAAYAVAIDMPDSTGEKDLARFKDRDMLCTLHRGRYDAVGDAYVSAARWMSDNGYRVDGMIREMIVDGFLGSARGSSCTVELQIPIRPADRSESKGSGA